MIIIIQYFSVYFIFGEIMLQAFSFPFSTLIVSCPSLVMRKVLQLFMLYSLCSTQIIHISLRSTIAPSLRSTTHRVQVLQTHLSIIKASIIYLLTTMFKEFLDTIIRLKREEKRKLGKRLHLQQRKRKDLRVCFPN